MIVRRFFSCNNKAVAEIVKHIEDNVVHANQLHSDIYKRQDYVQRQLNDVYFDIGYIDKRLQTIESAIERLNIRINYIESCNSENHTH